MSWFDAASLSKYAKTALKNAQKNIDKVLDIKDEEKNLTPAKSVSPEPQSKELLSTSIRAKKDISKKIDSEELFFDSFLKDNDNISKPTNKPRKTTIKNKKIENVTLGKNVVKSALIEKENLNDSVTIFDNESDKKLDFFNQEGGFYKQIDKNLGETKASKINEVLKNEVTDYFYQEKTPINIERNQPINVEAVDQFSDDTDGKTDDMIYSSDNYEIYDSEDNRSYMETKEMNAQASEEINNTEEVLNTKRNKKHKNTHPDNSTVNNIVDIDSHCVEVHREIKVASTDESESFQMSIICDDPVDSIKEGIDCEFISDSENSQNSTSAVNDETKLIKSDKDLIKISNKEPTTISKKEASINSNIEETQCPKEELTLSSNKEPIIILNKESSTIYPSGESTINSNIKDTLCPNEELTLSSNKEHTIMSNKESSAIYSGCTKNNNTEPTISYKLGSALSSNKEPATMFEKESTIQGLDGIDSIQKSNKEFNSNGFAKHKADIDQPHLPTIFTKEILHEKNDEVLNDTVSIDSDNLQEEEQDNENEGKEKNSEQVLLLEKQVEDLQNILCIREEKLLQLSKENISLNESVGVYKSQLEQLQTIDTDNNEDVEKMQQEFSIRICEFENKLKTIVRDRDEFKKILDETEDRMNTSINEQVHSLNQSLVEKEETIKGLLSEGESLSKKELESNNRIKKLKAKLREVMKENKDHLDMLDNKNKELQLISATVVDKETNETKLKSEVKKLESISDSQEDELTLIKDKFEDMEEKYKAMEATLQNCYSEINKLNLEKAQADSVAQEAMIAIETKQALQEKLNEFEKKSKYGNEELITQLENLQQAFTRLGQQSARKEEHLKNEIQDLQQGLEDSEKRNQELSKSVTTATRPLLRQIENLQTNHNNHAANCEKIENSLTERLGNIQHEMEVTMEKERTATEVANEIKSKYKILDQKYKLLKEDKLKLEASMEDEISRSADEISFMKREKEKLEKKCNKLKKAYESLQNEKDFIEEQSTADKIRFENDLSQLNSTLLSHQLSRNSCLNDTFNREDSLDSTHMDAFQSSTNERSRNNSIANGFSRADSLTNEMSRSMVTTVSMELVQSQLRKREGEVYIFKEEIKTLENTKASLAKELVKLTSKLEEQEGLQDELIVTKQDNTDLKSRYNAVLQMYGEKAEEADELKMDLVDVKAMYKQQIEQLLGGDR